MMLEILYNHLAVVLTFLTVGVTAWLYGGTRPAETAAVLPWFLALTLEALFFFPQRRPYEDIIHARARVWHNLVRDPVFYVMLGFLALLAVPFLNHGLCPNCDIRAIAAGAEAAPPVPFLPFCVNVRDHAAAFSWFVPAFFAMLAVRHALTREGKRVFIEMVVWNAVALVVFGFIEQATGAKFVFWETPEHPVYFFATFGYPNAAGIFLVMTYAFAIGLWRCHAQATEELRRVNRERHIHAKIHYWLRAHYMLAAVVLILFGILYTRSRAAVLFLVALSFAGAAYVVLEALGRTVAKIRRLKMIAFTALGMFIIGFSVLIFAPKSIAEEINGTDLSAIANRITGKGEWHITAAMEIFKEHPMFGVGCWGYKHLCLPYVPENARRSFGLWYNRGGANVHNDYMQFLCEHGLVGVLLLLSIVLLILCPVAVVWHRLYQAALFVRADKAPARPKAVFAFPAGAFWILAGNLCLCIHAFGDCPLRGGAVLALTFTSLAAVEGFLPRLNEVEGAGEGEK